MVRSVPELAILQAIPRELPDPAAPCRYAQDLTSFSQALIATLKTTPAKRFEDALIDSKCRLLDRYARCKADARAPHENAAGNEQHKCVTDCLDDEIAALAEVARLHMPPPKLGKTRIDDDDAGPPRRMAFGLGFDPTQAVSQPAVNPLPTRLVRVDE